MTTQDITCRTRTRVEPEDLDTSGTHDGDRIPTTALPVVDERSI